MRLEENSHSQSQANTLQRSTVKKVTFDTVKQAYMPTGNYSMMVDNRRAATLRKPLNATNLSTPRRNAQSELKEMSHGFSTRSQSVQPASASHINSNILKKMASDSAEKRKGIALKFTSSMLPDIDQGKANSRNGTQT